MPSWAMPVADLPPDLEEAASVLRSRSAEFARRWCVSRRQARTWIEGDLAEVAADDSRLTRLGLSLTLLWAGLEDDAERYRLVGLPPRGDPFVSPQAATLENP
ncbi:MAG: hypothetical protein WD651_06600 [Acidimicrobiia bacterium]